MPNNAAGLAIGPLCYTQPVGEQDGSDLSALSPRSLLPVESLKQGATTGLEKSDTQRTFLPGGIEEAGAEPRGMAAAGTYAITGLLLVIVVAAAAFGWSQVEIVTVGGREEALTPAWMWLAFLLTLIGSIVGARADHSTLYSSHTRFWFHREGSDGAHGLMLSLIRVNVSLLRPVALLRAEKDRRGTDHDVLVKSRGNRNRR